jgi:hypothetical protein
MRHVKTFKRVGGFQTGIQLVESFDVLDVLALLPGSGSRGRS